MVEILEYRTDIEGLVRDIETARAAPVRKVRTGWRSFSYKCSPEAEELKKEEARLAVSRKDPRRNGKDLGIVDTYHELMNPSNY